MISRKQCLDYEIHSSKWANKIGNKYLQKIAGTYFAWKVRKKYNRYLISKNEEIEFKNRKAMKENFTDAFPLIGEYAKELDNF